MNLIYKAILKILPVIYFMYLFSLVTSMAGMEMFGWSGIFLTIYVGIYEYVVYKKNIFVSHPLNRIFLILALALAVTVLSAPYATEEGIPRIYYLGRIRNLIFFTYNIIIFNRIFSYQKSLKILLYFTIPLVLYAFLRAATGFDPIHGNWNIVWNLNLPGGIKGFFNSYLTYTNIFQFHFFILLSFLIIGKMGQKIRFLLLSITIAYFLSLVLSGSRAIVIALFFGIITQAILSRKLAYILVVIIMITAPFIAFKTNSRFKAKVYETLQYKKYMGDDRRIYFLKAHLEMFKDHPVKGVGYGMNEPLSWKYYKKLGITNPRYFAGHSHNIVVQMLSGTGLLGTIPFIILWIMIFGITFRAFRTALRLEDWYHIALLNGIMGGLVSFIVNGMTQWNFGDFEVNHNLMFFIAIAGYVWKKQKETEKLVV